LGVKACEVEKLTKLGRVIDAEYPEIMVIIVMNKIVINKNNIDFLI